MKHKRLFGIIGIISISLFAVGLPLAVSQYSINRDMFYLWLVVAILGFIGLCTLVVFVLKAMKEINTSRDYSKKE